ASLLGGGLAAELPAVLMGLDQGLLDHVGRIDLAGQARVELQPGQQVQVIAVVLDGPRRRLHFQHLPHLRSETTRKSERPRRGEGSQFLVPLPLLWPELASRSTTAGTDYPSCSGKPAGSPVRCGAAFPSGSSGYGG